MIKNKTAIKLILILILFSSIKISGFLQPRQLTKNLCLSAALFHFIAIWQQTPNLYEQKADEDYLQLVEKRVNNLKVFLDNPSEEQLLLFRYTLICDYKEILASRGLFSMIFERAIPYQPWALLDEEINQHLHNLDLYRSKLSIKILHQCKNSEVLQLELDKVENLGKLLTKIKWHLQSYTSYQAECFFARQEATIYKTLNLIAAIFLFYLANQKINS